MKVLHTLGDNFTAGRIFKFNTYPSSLVSRHLHVVDSDQDLGHHHQDVYVLAVDNYQSTEKIFIFLYLTFRLSVCSASAANSKHKHSLHDFPSETGGGDGSTCLASKLSFSLSLQLQLLLLRLNFNHTYLSMQVALKMKKMKKKNVLSAVDFHFNFADNDAGQVLKSKLKTVIGACARASEMSI